MTTNMLRMAPTKYLDMAAVADFAGLSYNSVRAYHTQATRRRREGRTRPGDLPPPDQVYGSAPVWMETTIRAWLENRPGRGVGGGRPAHKKPM